MLLTAQSSFFLFIYFTFLIFESLMDDSVGQWLTLVQSEVSQQLFDALSYKIWTDDHGPQRLGILFTMVTVLFATP